MKQVPELDTTTQNLVVPATWCFDFCTPANTRLSSCAYQMLAVVCEAFLLRNQMFRDKKCDSRFFGSDYEDSYSRIQQRPPWYSYIRYQHHETASSQDTVIFSNKFILFLNMRGISNSYRQLVVIIVFT